MAVTARSGSVIGNKQRSLRDQFWPNQSGLLWHRIANKGFTTIPKTMPLVLRIMDELSKGRPISSTYMTLWCSTWDNSFVTLNKHREMATAAGFTGQRGERTWADRMKLLQQLRFIDIKPGASGPMAFALIYNPHFVIRWHWSRRTPGLIEASYNSLVEWANEIGANDMTAEVLPKEFGPEPAAAE